MEAEKIAVCDEEGIFLKVASRQEVHGKGYWHETFHCWFVGRKQGKDIIHLQLRSKDKKDFPGLFDITAAGHILADETMEDGVREVEEELGIAVSFEELIPLGVIKDQIHENDFLDNERCHVFLYKAETNIAAMYKLQKEEVAGMMSADFSSFYDMCMGTSAEMEVEGIEWLPGGEKAAIQKSVSLKNLVPHGKHYLRDVALAIKSELDAFK
ncbi:NUDIX domain-containing protein [Planomicrobium sp. CPCC 101079]|uniref:NUDIX hydrolase n=1 Tax=Planomicrobium sp. CPCC 101079 TaxID=2599618 RepID=UPI0011B4462D|nr:NUDIX domain-containing protein [Planomicrobium sp. CPCC 101079]TWT02520.1 NUDIX domain-containing protein [Planomicrobium sp. CPCC 101079]